MEQVIRDRISIFQRKRVPDGYKKLYNGILPKDWHVKKICDIKDPNDKYSLTGGPFGSDLKSEHYTDDGIRIIQLQNIGDGRFIDDYKIYTSHKKADELINCNIYPGEIIIAKMAEPLARACIIPSIYNRYLMASDGIRLNVDNSKYNSKFVLECINSSYFRAEAIKRGTGTTRLRIGLNVLGNLKIPVPSLTEQKKIADIFSTWDKAIELKEKLIEEKKKHKKGLMQKLLTGNVRFTGFNDAWEEVKFGKVFKFLNKERVSEPQNYKLLTVKLHLKGIEATEKYPNDTKNGRPYYLREPNEILIGRQNYHNGGIGIVPSNMKNYIASNAISSLTTIKGDLMFLFYYISNVDFYKRVGHMIGGTGQKEISETTMKKLILRIPKSLEEQKKIGEVLKTADNEIDLLERELEALKQQKKGLIQLLLTGILRVNTQVR